MPGTTSPLGFRYPLYTEANNGSTQIQNLANDIDAAVTVAQANTALAVTRKRAAASETAAQSIPNNVLTALTYGTEEFDNDNMINLGVNNTLITATSAGIYLVECQVQFASNATGDRELDIVWSGGGGQMSIRSKAVATDITRLSVSFLYKATAAQTFQSQVLQNSGGALNVTTRRFSATRVSG